MTDINTIINTCYETTKDSRIIASYSHLIPVVLSMFLAVFVFIKSRYNLFSKIFLIFVIAFSFWLIGDFIVWTSDNYNLVYASWAPLDLIEIVFYILGLYFILVFTNKKDISLFKKILLILLILPAFIITITNQSITSFNYPVCEAFGNSFLGIYKLAVEGVLLFIMFLFIIIPFIKKLSWEKRKTRLILIGSMFLFLSIFGVTEYLASSTGYYEMNLYSLFLLPILIVAIIYAVFELDIFNFKMLGTQYLVVGLVILIVGQLFFVNGATDRLLTILTVILTVSLSIILYRNLKKESDQRIRIEKLSAELELSNIHLEVANEKLKGLDKLKTEFVSLASHQLRSPLTAIKGYTSMLLQGDYGEIDPKVKETIDRILESSNNLTLVVEDLLDVAKIEQGGMKYEMEKFDFGEETRNTAKDLSITAEKKGLKLIYDIKDNQKYFVNGDKEKLRQVLINLIDNSIKYTKEGQIEINLRLEKEKIILSIKDTGVGISSDVIETLFEKFSRGDKSELNTSGSGLGLYLVKEIIEAHKGRVWVESEGVGKGSTFFVELDEVK